MKITNLFWMVLLGSVFSPLVMAEIEEKPWVPPTDEQLAEIYKGIPEALWSVDHTDIKTAFKDHVRNPSEWVGEFNSSDYDLLCIGESHDAAYRSAVANNLFSGLRMDQFLIEANDKETADLLSGFKRGEPVSLLEAPFFEILTAAFSKNAHLQVWGVEQTQEQSAIKTRERLVAMRSKITRETFISMNLLKAVKPGLKNVVLFGSSHCGLFSQGMGLDTPFYRLLQPILAKRNLRSTNLKVIFADQYPALVAGLKQYGYFKDQPVILSRLNEIDPASMGFNYENTALFASYHNLLILPGSPK